MKISLDQEQGVPVLVVVGDVNDHYFKVLRAGITKLFKDGKNKMVVEFGVGTKISQDYLREIAMLNVLARELAGNIVLAIPDPSLRQQVSAYSKPPALECYENRKLAVDGMKATLAAASRPVPAAPPATLEVAPQQGSLTKSEIRDNEANTLHTLRSKIEELQKQNDLLQDKLLTLFNDRGTGDDAAQSERVKGLEKQLEEALAQLQKQG